jgi:hypothetical protein
VSQVLTSKNEFDEKLNKNVDENAHHKELR